MILGNAAWGFRETPLEKQLEITRNMGLELLELGIAGHPNDRLQLDASSSQIAEVKKLYQSYGIRTGCFATGNDFTCREMEENFVQLENVKKAADICSKLGGGYLRIFSGFEKLENVTEKCWRTMIECLTETANYCSRRNVVPVVETHGAVEHFANGMEHFFSTSAEPEALYRMISEVPVSLKVNFDPANLYAVGIEHPEEVYLKLADRVAYMHLKDFIKIPGTKLLRAAACGESNMDWHSLMDAVADYRGPALIEYENVEDVEAGCRRSLDFINVLLKLRNK